MADFIPLRCSASFRLLAGTNPESGKPIHKTVTISGVLPTLPAADFKKVEDKLSPMFDYTLVESRKSRTDLVE